MADMHPAVKGKETWPKGADATIRRTMVCSETQPRSTPETSSSRRPALRWRDRLEGWLFHPASRRFVVVCVTASFGLFFLLINKWLVTGLGLFTFGRVWPFFVSYRDFGFVRRAFIGTLLDLSHACSLFRNEYVFAYCVAITTGALLFLLLGLLVARTRHIHRVHVLCICLSPSILHFSMGTGTLDMFLFVILLLILLSRKSLVAMALLTVAGVFTHEAMLFYVPFLLATFNLPTEDSSRRRNLLASGVVATAALVAALVVVLHGKTTVDRGTYMSVMATKIPNAAGKHAFWSGYYELASGIHDNARVTHDYVAPIFENHNWLWLVVPLTYIAILAALTFYVQAVPLVWRLAHTVGILFPLTICFVAADSPRWFCMSANLGLLSTLFAVGASKLIVPRRALVLLLCFFVVAPFGKTDYRRPFPMHQMVVEKLEKAYRSRKANH